MIFKHTLIILSLLICGVTAQAVARDFEDYQSTEEPTFGHFFYIDPEGVHEVNDNKEHSPQHETVSNNISSFEFFINEFTMMQYTWFPVTLSIYAFSNPNNYMLSIFSCAVNTFCSIVPNPIISNLTTRLFEPEIRISKHISAGASFFLLMQPYSHYARTAALLGTMCTSTLTSIERSYYLYVNGNTQNRSS